MPSASVSDSVVLPEKHAHQVDGLGRDHHVGVEAGVLHAHRRVAAVEHHPDPARHRVPVVELDDDPLVGEGRGLDPPVHPPGERDRVDLGRQRARRSSQRTTTRPRAMMTGSRSRAGLREVVLVAPAGGGRAELDDAFALEVRAAAG